MPDLVEIPQDIADPRIEFERRYCYQALETSVVRGDPEIICRGPRGTGKTLMLCDFFHRLNLRYAGMTQVWMRKNRSNMDDTLLKTFEEELLGMGHPMLTGARREQRTGYRYPNGSQIVLTGMSSQDRPKGMPGDVFWINECNELTEQEWEEVGAANRERVGLSQFHYQFKMGDCNPQPPAHWTNERCARLPSHLYPRVLDDGTGMGEALTMQMYAELAEWNLEPMQRPKQKTKMIVSCFADNPGYWSIIPWGLLPPGLRYIRDKLAPLGSYLRARYLEGRPMAAQGAVYPEFDPERHVVRPFVVPRDWPSILAEDPGYDHPTAILVATRAPNGRIYIPAELSARMTTVAQDAAWIKGEVLPRFWITRMLGDPHYMFSKNKHNSGRTIGMQMSELGLGFVRAPAASNQSEIDQQVQQVRTLLTTTLSDGLPALQIFECCPATIRGFQTWGYQRNARGDQKGGEDRFEDIGDDEMDCVRMLISSQALESSPHKITVEGRERLAAKG